MMEIDKGSGHCDALRHPDPFTVLLASVILAGILVSYLPQHIKIIRLHSSEGLSPYWVLLGGLSSIFALGNIISLPASRGDLRCCKEISGGACAAALLGVGQIALQWAGFMFIVMLFLIFFPTHPESDLSLASSTSSHTSAPRLNRRDAVLVASTTLLALLVVGITSIALVAAWPHHTQTWADVLGSVAGVLAMVQYVPQIWYTYRLADVKSLSVVTMLIQVPGSFLFAFSLWQRLSWEGWSTWLVYLVTGLLQACLLTLAIIYYMAQRRGNNFQDGDDDFDPTVDDVDGAVARVEGTDERTTLLSHGKHPDPVGNGRRSVKSVPGRPINGTQRSNASQRQLSMLYAATPPEHDSDRSSSGRGR